MKPKEACHNTAYSVKLPYKAGLSLKTFCLMPIKSDGEIQRNKHFEPKKKMGSSTFLIRIRFQGYRCFPCMEGHLKLHL